MVGMSEAEDVLRKDAERWRVMRDRCAWTMTSANGIVRVAFRVPVELEEVAETGDDLNDLADAALALFSAVDIPPAG